ncbi:MAG TPA: hypothetical protein VMJ10_33555 [Kofleriaceae bacterium]|nr:hypothetical protein [Kofleriaceae bacterium]
MRTTLAIGFAVVAAAATASAQPAAAPAAPSSSPLGQKGTWILAIERAMPLFAYTREETDGNNASQETSETSLSFLSYGVPSDIAYTIPRVALDYTVAPNITVGGSIFAFFDVSDSTTTTLGNMSNTADNPKATAFGISGRVGYVMSLGPKLALWPRGGLSFYDESISNPGGGGAGTTMSSGFHQFALDLEGNFAFTLAPHVFVLLGPVIDIPLTGSVSTTTSTATGSTTTSTDNSQFHFGIAGGLGGYL